MDKDSGLFFWFNCKDESSQWADTEGEGWAGYGSRRASSVNPDTVYTNALVATKSGLSLSRIPSASSSPPRSPRAPTAADEKETDAAGKAADSKKVDEKADAAPKKRGIADEEEEGESAKQSPADAKDADAPISRSNDEQKEDEAIVQSSKSSPSKSTKSVKSPKAVASVEKEVDTDVTASFSPRVGTAEQDPSAESKSVSKKESSSARASPAKSPSVKVASAAGSPSKKAGMSSKENPEAVEEDSNAAGSAQSYPRATAAQSRKITALERTATSTTKASEGSSDEVPISPTASSTKENAAE